VLGAHLLGGLAFAARAQRLEPAQCGVSNCPVTTTLTVVRGGELERQRTGGGRYPAAEHRAERQLWRGLDDRAGGHEDQSAVSVSREMGRCRAADLERRSQHRVVGGVVVAVGGEDRAGCAAARVDDDDVEPAEGGHGIGDDSCSRARFGQVDRQPGGGTQCRDRGAGAPRIAAGDGNRGTLSDKHGGDGAAETAGRAEHERPAPVQPEIHQVPIQTVRDTV
jgi:hypothetical protein